MIKKTSISISFKELLERAKLPPNVGLIKCGECSGLSGRAQVEYDIENEVPVGFSAFPFDPNFGPRPGDGHLASDSDQQQSDSVGR